MTTGTAGQLFRDGRLDDAVAAAGEAVRRWPADLGHRVLLAELRVLAGAWARADAILVAAEAADPDAALVVAEFRQLLRAAAARREVAAEGRLPDFIGKPTQAQTLALEALVALRAGDRPAAEACTEAMDAARPELRGNSDGTAFAGFRDADDLCSASFEVLTTTGKYFWIDAERVTSLEFHPPKRPRDLVWRRCSMSLRDGPDGDVYVPALYEPAPGQPAEPIDDALRLGRRTSWSETTPVRGAGQRVFLVGEEGMPVTALGTLEFA